MWNEKWKLHFKASIHCDEIRLLVCDVKIKLQGELTQTHTVFASLQSDSASRLQPRGAAGLLHLPTLSHTGHKLSDQKSSELYVIVIIRLIYKNGLKYDLESIKVLCRRIWNFTLYVKERPEIYKICKMSGALQTIKRTLKWKVLDTPVNILPLCVSAVCWKSQSVSGQYRMLVRGGGYVWVESHSAVIPSIRPTKSRPGGRQPLCILCVTYVLRCAFFY